MKTFLPFMSGVYTTAPGLTPTSRGADTTKILDIDENYFTYLKNKDECRKEDITKYHCLFEFEDQTRQAVVDMLVNLMTSEYPDVFEHSGNTLKNAKTGKSVALTFDMLCSQLQEDVAVVQMRGEKDWLTAIHLCSPNHWDPRTKIGRPFNEIHTPVPHIERTVKNYQVMLKMIIDKEPFTRFAWGIATDTRLNHHPEAPPGRNASATEFYVRTERQNLIGLKSVNAFIFTIRTYFYNVADLNSEEKKALGAAINSMSKESLDYKGMIVLKDLVLRELS
jgi:hypothetical protein